MDSMGLAAPVMNGKLMQNTANTTAAGAKGTGEDADKKSGSAMDKDSFLQLLVAQMKYQDPMEPTSNTEYISQYAQFSELEAMNNLSSNMDLQRATSLVGKEVIVKSTGASGETVYTQGKVDFVSSEGTKAFLTVDGKKFSIDDLDSVIDPEYSDAVSRAEEFTLSLNKLPSIQGLTPEYKKAVDNLTDAYNSLTPYQKNYLSKDTVDKYNLYIERMNQLVPATDTDNTTE